MGSREPKGIERRTLLQIGAALGGVKLLALAGCSSDDTTTAATSNGASGSSGSAGAGGSGAAGSGASGASTAGMSGSSGSAGAAAGSAGASGQAGQGGVAGQGGASPGNGGASGESGASGQAGGSDCTVTPEGEIGPYFADDSAAGFERSNLLSNLDGSNVQAGIPLTLTVTVLDGKNGCAPYANAQVDIWHCNASGIYSDEDVENTSTEQWLRGFQKTDAKGQVTFTTIIPGWYQGRTTHIHLRVRSTYSDASSTSDGTNTTQLFFPQSFNDTVQTTVAPYDAEGINPTTNAGDHVYTGEQDGSGVLTLMGDVTNGYTAAAMVVLPIAAATGTGGASGMGAGGGPPGAGGGPPGMGGGPPGGGSSGSAGAAGSG